MPHPPAGELVDQRGRKYLTADERRRFLAAVRTHPKPTVQTLARTLALTGCRVSEALAIRACDVDLEAAEIRIATLKRRREHWRAVPVPEELVGAGLVHRVRAAQASPRGRTRPLVAQAARQRTARWRRSCATPASPDHRQRPEAFATATASPPSRPACR